MIEKNINISTAILEKCAAFNLGIILAKVEVEPSSQVLLASISKQSESIQASLSIEKVSAIPTIASTRDAYRALGKKPGRYRPSAEALTRRVLNGKGLYQINNVVDLLNLVSITSGFSIGGYDWQKIEGDILLDVGVDNEPYEAIARGALNIGRLPVLRDESSAFGSPTSDSVRTSITENTKEFAMVFFNFGKHQQLKESMQLAAQLLEQHASGEVLRLDVL